MTPMQKLELKVCAWTLILSFLALFIGMVSREARDVAQWFLIPFLGSIVWTWRCNGFGERRRWRDFQREHNQEWMIHPALNRLDKAVDELNWAKLGYENALRDAKAAAKESGFKI